MIEKLIFSDVNKYRITRHITYWILIFLYFSLPYGFITDLVPFFLKRNIPYILLDIIIVYAIVYYLLPNLLKRKKYVLFFASYLIILIGNVLIKEIYFKVVEPQIFSLDVQKMNSLGANFSSSSVLINQLYFITSRYFITTLPPILITFFKNWYYSNLHIVSLERQSSENKIRFLRSQLHPHFLFNTLNNLYLLATEKSEKVPETIIKVSDILRYMLKEHNKQIVTLREEISIINSYIELEKLRYGDYLSVTMEIDIEENYFDRIKGPPLLLFTFVENAFKHGPNQSINKSWINININFENGIFTFIIENSKEKGFNDVKKENKNYNDQTGLGLGLQNAKSTLYLFFKEKFDLNISNKEDRFKVILKTSYNQNEDKMFNS